MRWSELIGLLENGEEVRVIWADADTTQDWREFGEEYCAHESLCESVGYILVLDPRFLVMYSTKSHICESDDLGEYMLTLKIPSGTIKSVERLPSWGKKHEMTKNL